MNVAAHKMKKRVSLDPKKRKIRLVSEKYI